MLSNGNVCGAAPLRDSNFFYWHHKARARRRRPEHAAAKPLFELPVLEDANAIQIAIQEVIQALLEQRLDRQTAGVLLYSLQLASTNLQHLDIKPNEFATCIASIGSDDTQLFNDCLGSDPRDDEWHQRRLAQQRAQLPPADLS